MKKVLFITYYWPPAGGSGVQRPLKFVKYLRDFGYEPIVYTVDQGEFWESDDSLSKDIPEGLTVLKKPIFEPYTLFKKISKKGEKQGKNVNPNAFKELKNGSLKNRFILWIRSNLFFPDARMFWIRPSKRYLKRYLKNNPVDAIISTGPPHSVHLIALGLKKKFDLPWVADFRDPWTKIEYYEDLSLTRYIDKKHHRLEKEVTQKAEAVLVIGPTMQEEYQLISGRDDIHVLFNGFDESDFEDEQATTMDEKFTVAHTGILRETQSHPAFWQAVGELCAENPTLKEALELQFIGITDHSIQAEIDRYNLQDNVVSLPYMKHNEITKIQRKAQVLLLIVNRLDNPRRIITGKIFEYLMAGRPIFCIAPTDGDAAFIVNRTETGEVAAFKDKEKMKQMLSAYFKAYQEGTLAIQGKNIMDYSRRNITQQLAGILDGIVK